MVIALALWPWLFPLAGIVSLIATGKVEWLIAAALATIAYFLYLAVDELSQMRAVQTETGTLVSQLVRAIGQLREAVERLAPEEKRTQERAKYVQAR